MIVLLEEDPITSKVRSLVGWGKASSPSDSFVSQVAVIDDGNTVASFCKRYPQGRKADTTQLGLRCTTSDIGIFKLCMTVVCFPNQ